MAGAIKIRVMERRATRIVENNHYHQRPSDALPTHPPSVSPDIFLITLIVVAIVVVAIIVAFVALFAFTLGLRMSLA